MIDRYARAEMKKVFSDESRYDTWWEVELAACEAMEESSLGLVPSGTAAWLKEHSSLLRPWDARRLAEIESETQHDVVAFLTYVEERLGERARFLHMGMTSSDVLDTSLSLLLRRSTEMVISGIEQGLLQALSKKAHEYKWVPIMGRSHGIHAEPITAGLVFASFYAEMQRAALRLRRAQHAISVGKLSGVVGVYGSGPLSPQTERKALSMLGLVPEMISTQIIPRDRHAELFLAYALLAAGIERIAITVRHWQRTEVGEAQEAFGRKQKGSSAMPHKKNPVLSENLCGLSRLLRAEALSSLENIALWHERDISHSSVERVIAPDVLCLADFMVARTTQLIDGLECHQSAMEKNISQTQGLVFSEKVLLALIGKGLSRQSAYERVQRNAMVALSEQRPLFELLCKDEEVTRYLTTEELLACFQIEKHLRHVDEMFERIFSLKEREATR